MLKSAEVDAPGDWRSLRETCRDVEAAAARADETGSEKDRRTLARAMEAHGRVAHDVLNSDQAWEELGRCSEMLLKLRKEERRLKESRLMSMTMDNVRYIVALQTALSTKYITDPVQRTKFAEDARLLASGQAVEIDEELLRDLRQYHRSWATAP